MPPKFRNYVLCVKLIDAPALGNELIPNNKFKVLIINDLPQNSGIFTWFIKAVDLKGRIIEKKGISSLLLNEILLGFIFTGQAGAIKAKFPIEL